MFHFANLARSSASIDLALLRDALIESLPIRKGTGVASLTMAADDRATSALIARYLPHLASRGFILNAVFHGRRGTVLDDFAERFDDVYGIGSFARHGRLAPIQGGAPLLTMVATSGGFLWTGHAIGQTGQGDDQPMISFDHDAIDLGLVAAKVAFALAEPVPNPAII